MLKEELRKIVVSQRDSLGKMKKGIPRELDVRKQKGIASVISGIRRCGKSTLAMQLAQGMDKFYYLNFEDPRLSPFSIDDFEKLSDVFSEEYGEGGTYIFDEIQNILDWERFVRSRLDQKDTFLLTGSNATLMSRELGTKLTGRNVRYELYPFSYREYISFRKLKAGGKSFRKYLNEGGFPQFLESTNQEYLRNVLEDIISRDIIVRHGIRNSGELKDLAVYLLNNPGKEFTYNALSKAFCISSPNTVISHISNLEDSYLLFPISRFSYSLKKQKVNPKKIYCIDTGMINANSMTFSDDFGRMLENSVFLELKRMKGDIFYYSGKSECDFLVKEGNSISLCVQVTWILTKENMEREANGLLEAMEEAKCNNGLILTFDQKDTIKYNGKTIKVIPAWEWMSEHG